ncbi:uncharacterized protein JCM6883_005444, partial [Sporobolomyces salmoneus]|uniref:uncharacterized protein n=1 Tax=Sporobolomyces salmoneus TaxID=183962 RepID=UPI00317CF98D
TEQTATYSALPPAITMTTLSSLPPELLRNIIESTFPHSYHSMTYKERQSTLCSLSLVSRQFRAIAQPLLFEIVSIETDEQLRSFLETRYDTFEPKELVVGRLVASEGTRGLLSRSKGLQSLTISRRREDLISLNILLEHTKLVNLQLSGDGFDFAVRGAFTSLRSLTLDWQAVDSSALLLLDPEVLPSLQALGLDAVTDEEEIQRLGETKLSQLLPQLDAIVIDLGLYRLGINDLFSGYSPRILIDVYSNTFDEPDVTRLLSNVQHLRIEESSTFTLGAPAAILTLLAASRESKSSSLKSIYLPLEWHPSRLHSPDIMIEMERVIKECEKAGIELVFDLQPEAYLDNFIPKEFW